MEADMHVQLAPLSSSQSDPPIAITSPPKDGRTCSACRALLCILDLRRLDCNTGNSKVSGDSSEGYIEQSTEQSHAPHHYPCKFAAYRDFEADFP